MASICARKARLRSSALLLILPMLVALRSRVNQRGARLERGPALNQACTIGDLGMMSSVENFTKPQTPFADCVLNSFRFMTYSNSRVVYVGIPKAASSSTKVFLQHFGEAVKDPFEYRLFSANVSRYRAVYSVCQKTPYLSTGLMDSFTKFIENKHVFTAVRSVNERIDSAAGTCLHRMPEIVVQARNDMDVQRTFQKLTEQYLSWLASANAEEQYDTASALSLHHLLPQSFFLEGLPPKTELFLVDESYGHNLERYIASIYTDYDVNSKGHTRLNVVRQREGGKLLSFSKYLSLHKRKVLMQYRDDERIFSTLKVRTNNCRRHFARTH